MLQTIALQEIKDKADAHAGKLKEALQSLEYPDLSPEFDAMTAKLTAWNNQWAATVKQMEYPQMREHVQELMAQADEVARQLKQEIEKIGFPNLVDDLNKAQAKSALYRSEAYQALNDLESIQRMHASDYAARRKDELRKKLGEIDAK